MRYRGLVLCLLLACSTVCAADPRADGKANTFALDPCRVITESGEEVRELRVLFGNVDEEKGDVLLVLLPGRGFGIRQMLITASIGDVAITDPQGVKITVGGPRAFTVHCKDHEKLRKALRQRGAMGKVPTRLVVVARTLSRAANKFP